MYKIAVSCSYKQLITGITPNAVYKDAYRKTTHHSTTSPSVYSQVSTTPTTPHVPSTFPSALPSGSATRSPSEDDAPPSLAAKVVSFSSPFFNDATSASNYSSV